MHTIEEAARLDNNDVIYFMKPLEFEFGSILIHQKAYVSKTTEQCVPAWIQREGMLGSSTVLEVTLSDADHYGEQCELSLDDISEGVIVSFLNGYIRKCKQMSIATVMNKRYVILTNHLQ